MEVVNGRQVVERRKRQPELSDTIEQLDVYGPADARRPVEEWEQACQLGPGADARKSRDRPSHDSLTAVSAGKIGKPALRRFRIGVGDIRLEGFVRRRPCRAPCLSG